jgi:hypothetical protein
MSRYLILSSELQHLSCNITEKNKEVVSNYISQELEKLEHKKQTAI